MVLMGSDTTGEVAIKHAMRGEAFYVVMPIAALDRLCADWLTSRGFERVESALD